MAIKRIRVNLSFIFAHLKRMRDFGREHRMQTSSSDKIKNASVCMKMITFLLYLRADEDVDRHLKENGGTLLDLIDRAVKKFIYKR